MWNEVLVAVELAIWETVDVSDTPRVALNDADGANEAEPRDIVKECESEEESECDTESEPTS